MTFCIQCRLESYDAPKREVSQHFCSLHCRQIWFKYHTEEEWQEYLHFYGQKRAKIKLIFKKIESIQRTMNSLETRFNYKMKKYEKMIDSRLKSIQEYEKVI